MVLPTFPLPFCQATASASFQSVQNFRAIVVVSSAGCKAPFSTVLFPFSFGTLPPRLIAILNFIRIRILIRFVVFLAVAIDFL